MKKECMELFKNDVVNGVVSLYGAEEIGCIKTLENASISQIVEEIKIAFENVDIVEYESDKIAMNFRRSLFEEEYAYEMIVFYEVANLMKNTEVYKEDDSRTHLYANIIESVNFMKKSPFVYDMTVIHKEDFLLDDEEISIKIFDVDDYYFSMEVMGDLIDFDYNHMDFEEWDRFWTNIFKRLGE